jgi:hypothetical protein
MFGNTKISFIAFEINHKSRAFIKSEIIGYIKNRGNETIFNIGLIVEFKSHIIAHHKRYVFQASAQAGNTTIELG